MSFQSSHTNLEMLFRTRLHSPHTGTIYDEFTHPRFETMSEFFTHPRFESIEVLTHLRFETIYDELSLMPDLRRFMASFHSCQTRAVSVTVTIHPVYLLSSSWEIAYGHQMARIRSLHTKGEFWAALRAPLSLELDHQTGKRATYRKSVNSCVNLSSL